MILIFVFDIEMIFDVDGICCLEDLFVMFDDVVVVEYVFVVCCEKIGSDFLLYYLQWIVVILCVFCDNNGFCVCLFGMLQDNEVMLIQLFYCVIEKYMLQFVLWNGGGFDLLVFYYCVFVYGIFVICYWDFGEDDCEFKWNNYILCYYLWYIDLMDVFVMYQVCVNVLFDVFVKLCGFLGKFGMDGSQVWLVFQDG